MGKPIIVLAGQSNFGKLVNEVRGALTEKYGWQGFHLVVRFKGGSVLGNTNQDLPAGTTWNTKTEGSLSSSLVEDLAKIDGPLSSDESSYIDTFIWVHGEADTAWPEYSENYGNAFRNSAESGGANPDVAVGMADLVIDEVKKIRPDTGVQNATWVISELEESAPANSGPDYRAGWETVIAQQEKLGRDNPTFTTVDPAEVAKREGFPVTKIFEDTVHYSTSFRKHLAKALVAATDQVGGRTSDTIFGNDGANRLDGRGGADVIVGNGGDDSILGRAGDDILRGGSGNDFLKGGKGPDVLKGNSGRDFLIGSAGDDKLKGGDGRDKLKGKIGDDALFGGAGADVLKGGRGSDVIHGSANDTITGGGGADRFVFVPGSGRNTITDLRARDEIDLTGYRIEASDLIVRQIGDMGRLDLPGREFVILPDTDIADIWSQILL